MGFQPMRGCTQPLPAQPEQSNRASDQLGYKVSAPVGHCMADDVSFIFFRAGRGDLDTAATALADCGLTVQRVPREFGDELTAGWPDGPQLRIAFVREPYVREEAEELSEDEEHAPEIS